MKRRSGAGRMAPGVALGVVLWLLAACGVSGPAAPESDLQIALLPPAGMGEETALVRVADAAGAAVTDAVASLEGNMNHAGMVPVMAEGVRDDADGAADGLYRLPFALSMLGDWIVTVTVEQVDGATVTRDFDVQVTSDGVWVEGVPVGQVVVQDVQIRPAPMAGGNGALFLTVVNHTTVEERLTSASSPAAATTELHETVEDNGVMRMRPRPEGYAIPPGGTLELKPGGKHIMLLNMVAVPAPGDTVEVTLDFAQAGPVTVAATVMAMEGMAQPGAAQGSMQATDSPASPGDTATEHDHE